MNNIYSGQTGSIGETRLKISVIMCAYTEARWGEMLAAVQSLKTQTRPPSEIVLVIDHNPTLLEQAQRHLHNSVKVIENSGQRGLSGARNSGLAQAHGDIIAFMDEDATAAPDWLDQLAKVYENPEVMGVGGAIHPVWIAGLRPAWFPEEFDWVVGCTYRGVPEVESQVRNLIGCNMSFRRSVCDVNGGFRDGIGRIGTLPVGCEETEYCIRASQRWPEKMLIFNPRARVFHKVPTTRAVWRYFCSRCYAEGKSKALIGQFVGSKDSLSSEKTYVMKTLPKGVLRGLASFVKFDINGLARAGAIVTGLGLTALGYLTTRLTSRGNHRHDALSASEQVFN